MKGKFGFLFVGLLALITMCTFACNQSEGRKVGVLQKVSHKTFPADYYTIEVAFEGGRMVSSSDGKSSAYQNTQEFKVDQVGYDTLQFYVGDRVVVEYNDDGFEVFGSSKTLLFLQVKPDRGQVIQHVPDRQSIEMGMNNGSEEEWKIAAEDAAILAGNAASIQ